MHAELISRDQLILAGPLKTNMKPHLGEIFQCRVPARPIQAVQKCIGRPKSKHSLSSQLSILPLNFLFPNLSCPKRFLTTRLGRAGVIWYSPDAEKFLHI